MKQIYDREMEQTERSLEKAFFPGVTDSNKDSTYDKEKEKTKRVLKKIEQYRYSEGEKLETISGDFPERFKSLKKEVDKTKSNFESNTLPAGNEDGHRSEKGRQNSYYRYEVLW